MHSALPLRIKNAAICLLVVVTACFALTASAQNQKVFGDWKIVCSNDGSESCYLSQNLALRESGQHILHVGVGIPPDGSGPVMVVTVPLGINLPPGVILKVDDTPSLNLSLQRCNPDGCHLNLPLDQVMIARLREGRWLTVEFQDAVGQRIQTPVSLIGFTRGLRDVSVRQ